MHRVQSFAKQHQFARALVSEKTTSSKLEDSAGNGDAGRPSPRSAAGPGTDAGDDADKSSDKPPLGRSTLQTASNSSTSPPQDTKEAGNGHTAITNAEKPSFGQRAKAGSLRFVSHTKDAIFHSWINVLLVFVPVGIAVNFAPLPEHTKPTIVFAMNAVAIIPLAGLLSHATESVASRMGDTLASLLNVTFGNAVELIIFIIALAKNEIRIVQASILGSILANLLLILGMCFVFGGLRFQEQKYNSIVTQMSACLLSLSVMSLLLPTAFHYAFSSGSLADAQTTKISRGTSVVLLIVYVLYLLFQLKSHSYLYESTPQRIIDEEFSTPGLINDILPSSSSNDTPTSGSEMDWSDSSRKKSKKRIKRVFGRHRKDSTSSTRSPSTVLTSPSIEMESVLEETRDPSASSYFDASPRLQKESQAAAVFSGDEADDDDGDKAIRVRDFEQRGESSKSPERKSKKKKRHTKNPKNPLHKRHEKEKHTNDEEIAETKADDDKKAVAFADNSGDTTNDNNQSGKRPFTKRQRTAILDALPNVFSNTVFSNSPSNLKESSQPSGLSIARKTGHHLRRTSSLPDRLVGQPPARGNTLNMTRSEPSHHTSTDIPARVGSDQPGLPTKKDSAEAPEMSRTAAIMLLLISTGLVAFCAELLVDAIPQMIKDTTVSQAFIGLIVLPIVGNAAEHVTAVTVATKNKMDLAIGVAVGSSIQIALFVTPVIVLLGWIMNKAMSLYFNIFETVSLFVTVFVVNFLVLDGRSNYLEGSLLMATYVIIALAAFFYPSQIQQSAAGGGGGGPGY